MVTSIPYGERIAAGATVSVDSPEDETGVMLFDGLDLDQQEGLDPSLMILRRYLVRTPGGSHRQRYR